MFYLDLKNLKVELIVVDDGSDDGTEELVADIKIKNSNVNFIKRKEEKSLPSLFIKVS